MARLTPVARQVLTQTMRRSIVDAGKEIISAEGMERLTANRVAERVGVARGTLYNYFKNRDDFMLAILEESFTDLLAELERLQEEAMPPLEKLQRIAAYMLEDGGRRQRLLQAVKREGLPGLEADFRRCHYEVVTRIETIFVAGVKDGGLAPMDSMVAAAIFYGALRELCCLLGHGQLERDPQQLYMEFSTTLLLAFQKRD